MRFLADESVDFAVVRVLRSAGLDVVAIAEVSPRATDAQVAERAVRERRVLVTEDRDFEWASLPTRRLDRTGRRVRAGELLTGRRRREPPPTAR